MKITVIGTGAVGGYFGAKLVNAGYDVSFIGTENSTNIIKEKGFYIKSPKGDIEIKEPKISSNIEISYDSDIILVCTKAYTTLEIAQGLKNRIKPDALVISLQNGVQNEKILASHLGATNVIAASIYLSASSPEAGVVEHGGSGKIILGELDNTLSERLDMLKELFLKADIPTSTSDSLLKDMWVKLIVNSAYNGLTAIIEKSLKDINSIPHAKEAYFDILKEGQGIANAEGIEITDTEIEKIYSMLDQPVFVSFKSSTLQDFEKGKPLELDAIQGEIIETAKRHSLKAPLNNLIYSILKLKTIY